MFNLLKDTLQGNDGKWSYRRLTALIFVLLSLYTAIFKVNTDQTITAFMYELVFILVIMAVITIDKLIVLVKTFKGN